MTDTLERELRRSLADHAPDPSPTVPDPWQRVQRGVTRRRRRRAGAAAGSLALVVAVGAGAAVLQPWAGTDRSDRVATDATSGWALDDGTPRGSLAGDDAVREQVEERLREQLAAQGGPTVAPGALRLVLAHDLPGTRLVVAVAPTEAGAVAIELVGDEGAAVADLAVLGETVLPVDASSEPVVAVVRDGADGQRLVAAVPAGATASVSPAVVVRDGVLTREWDEAQVSGEGVVDVALEAAPASGVAVVRVDSVPGLDADGPVAARGVGWGSGGDLDVVAEQVAAGGPLTYREGEPAPRPADPGETLADVRAALDGLGAPAASDVRLLYASPDGADVERGAQGWSSLVAARVGGGSVLVWQQHLADGGSVRVTTAPAQGDPATEQVALRAPLDRQQDLVGVWDPQGTLGTVTVDGADAVMPLATGLRWFPVPAGAEVVVDGRAVPAAPQEPTLSWALPGEQVPGPFLLGR
jgi:hypothetical protein